MKEDYRKIWLAGGCFWGVQAYFSAIPGVISTNAGYANGRTEKATYHDIPVTGHAEAVEIVYDPSEISLKSLLSYYFHIIDPASRNKQGNDIGTQYRTGIYYKDEDDKQIIEEFIRGEQQKYSKPIAVETGPLLNYTEAEEYHQNYLKKNPGGYCHIDLNDVPKFRDISFKKPSEDEIKKNLTDMQYKVTRENATEPPFDNEYWNNHQKGIYVDIVTGEPLFSSSDKFDSGCGWPSFTKPIKEELLRESEDSSYYGYIRTEVRSKLGDTHLGHVFDDGPIEKGGLRYCINSASIRFIPIERMEEEGYGAYIGNIG